MFGKTIVTYLRFEKWILTAILVWPLVLWPISAAVMWATRLILRRGPAPVRV